MNREQAKNLLLSSVAEFNAHRAKHPGWVPDFGGQDLGRTILVGADLRGAEFRGAKLIWSDLREVNLSGADLRDADLRGAILHRANLTGARIVGANFRRSKLVNVRGLSPSSDLLIGGMRQLANLIRGGLAEVAKRMHLDRPTLQRVMGGTAVKNRDFSRCCVGLGIEYAANNGQTYVIPDEKNFGWGYARGRHEG